jgi:hypothetical protein
MHSVSLLCCDHQDLVCSHHDASHMRDNDCDNLEGPELHAEHQAPATSTPESAHGDTTQHEYGDGAQGLTRERRGTGSE